MTASASSTQLRFVREAPFAGVNLLSLPDDAVAVERRKQEGDHTAEP
jgi:hypothetical protein